MKHALKYFTLVLALVCLAPARPLKLNGLLAVEQALATITLDPTDGSFTLGTFAGKISYARYLYFLINGPGPGYAIRGPETGFAGIINPLTGNEGIGSILRSGGYASCAELPNSGTAAGTDNEGHTYQLVFLSPSTRTIPSHFANSPTESFDKRLTIARDGVAQMEIELKCDLDSPIVSGYFRLDGIATDETDGRQLETYFQTNADTKARFVDIFMSYPEGGEGEKLAARFLTLDGNEYHFQVVRTVTSGLNAVNLSLHGKKNHNLADFRFVQTLDINDASDVGSQTEFCLDLALDTSSDQCGTHDLSARTATTSTSVNGTPFTWTIDSTNDLILSAL